MHVVKIGDRYLGLVDSQVDALRMPDAEDGRVLTGALLAATVKGGDNLPEGRPVLLTTRAMRAARLAAMPQPAEVDQLEPSASSPAVDAFSELRDAFNAAIDRLAARLSR